MELTVAQALFLSAGVSAAGAMYTANQQKALYDAQAAQAKLQGRSQAIAYKQESADILRGINENIASTIAYAAANNVSPLEGSPLRLQEYAFSEGIVAVNTAKDNAILAEGMAGFQADQYTQAGKVAQTSGYIDAAGSMASGYAKYKYYDTTGSIV